jgi:hypothetical protein
MGGTYIRKEKSEECLKFLLESAKGRDHFGSLGWMICLVKDGEHCDAVGNVVTSIMTSQFSGNFLTSLSATDFLRTWCIVIDKRR